MSDIKVRIYGEFNDRAWTRAQKKTTVLEKSFATLGKTMLAVFSAQKIISFSQDAVKAFMDDEKAAAALSKTLDNLGLSFEDPRVRNFIAQLETASGVADDLLRPALQKLITQTGSVSKSQELLTLALDISAGSGVDLATVADDLAKAYVGNTRGLKKYALGLTDAELKAMSFAEIQAALAEQFGGQNAAFLDTYAGQLSQLNIAYQNLKETIGKELVDAFSKLGGDEGISGAVKAIGSLGEYFGTVIRAMGTGLGLAQKILDKINSNPVLKWLIEHFNPFGAAYTVGQLFGDKKQTTTFTTPMSISGQSDYYAKQDKARAKAETDAAKRAKDLAALQKKNAAAAALNEKKNQQLKRAGTVFDIENIQIVAALQGRISEEQRLRLVALLAINNDNADAAEKLTSLILALQKPAFEALGITISTADNAETIVNKLINAQSQLLLVNLGITKIPNAKNPFADWDAVMKAVLDNLDKISEKLKLMPKLPGWDFLQTQQKDVPPKDKLVPDTLNLVPKTPAQIIAEELKIEVPGAFKDTSLANDPNLLSTARLTAQLNDILEQFKVTNDLSTARWEALQRLYPGQQFSATMISDYAAMRSGERGDISVTVNVGGSVTAERDLVNTITNQLYQFQQRGGEINLSAVSI